MKRFVFIVFCLGNLLLGTSSGFDLATPPKGPIFIKFFSAEKNQILQVAEDGACGQPGSSQANTRCTSGRHCCYSSDRFGPAWCCGAYEGCGNNDYQCTSRN